MQGYDLIMLIVLSMATIFGAIKGFAWQVASLASVVVSYFVAYRFRFDVAEMIQAKPPWNQFLAMLILYVGTSFVIWVGFRLLSGMIDRVRLKEFDRHLGAAFGLAKGLIYCLLITMFALSLLGPNQQATICQSRSGYYIASALDCGVGILPKEIHDVVGPYLAKLDNKLKEGQQGVEPDNGAGGLGAGGLGGIWPDLDSTGQSPSPGGLRRLPDLQEALNGIQIPNSGFQNGAGIPAPNNGILPPAGVSGSGNQVPGYQAPVYPGNTQYPGNTLRPSNTLRPTGGQTAGSNQPRQPGTILPR